MNIHVICRSAKIDNCSYSQMTLIIKKDVPPSPPSVPPEPRTFAPQQLWSILISESLAEDEA